MPIRIQRKRTRGWRMPGGCVYVGRFTRFGNPFIVSTDQRRLAHYEDYTKNVDLWHGWPVQDRATAARAYREMVAPYLSSDLLRKLRGKDLACWCPLDQPCHADVLLELANAEQLPSGRGKS